MANTFGLNDAAITTNDLLKKFSPTLVQRLEEKDAFGVFYHEMPKPDGMGRKFNVEVSATSNEAVRQAPGEKRVALKRKAYEVEIEIKDKFRASYPILWEKIREGRINEPETAVQDVAMSLARSRNRELGRFLTGDATDNGGTPTAPAAAAVGETPYPWNATDVTPPPTYGENVFAAGHNHLETGAAAPLTLDRLRDVFAHMLEHGYGENGFVVQFQNQEEKTLLKLANAQQANQTLVMPLREELQRSGRASGANGLLGAEYVVNEWMPAGVVLVADKNLAGLPQGGAVKYTELPVTSDSEDEKSTHTTWFEGYEQFGAGVLHKGAVYAMHVA